MKGCLAEKGCKTVSEDPPKHLLVRHGSLWGVSPATAKKELDFTFTPLDSGTEVTCSSRLNSDWKNLTIIGCALAAVLVGVCFWIAVDVSAFMISGKPTFWSWLASVNGMVDTTAAQTLVNLTKALALFLSVVTVLDIAVAAFTYKKIDDFARAVLDALSKSESKANVSTQ